MSENQPYIRILADIIDSGVWARLSSAARTLYPVLLKFSDSNFKPVWPNTETLLGLTGFQSKKSLNEAKKDLEKNGLLHVVPGSGRTSTRYYFLFDYPGSKIPPQRDTTGDPRGFSPPPSEGQLHAPMGGTQGLPNHINITIHNNQTNKTPHPHPSHPIKKRNKEVLNNKQNFQTQDSSRRTCSWRHFLEWVDTHLSASSAKEFHSIDVYIDGLVLCIQSPVTPLQKNIIESYFSRACGGDVHLVFASPKVQNRII